MSELALFTTNDLLTKLWELEACNKKNHEKEHFEMDEYTRQDWLLLLVYADARRSGRLQR